MYLVARRGRRGLGGDFPGGGFSRRYFRAPQYLGRLSGCFRLRDAELRVEIIILNIGNITKALRKIWYDTGSPLSLYRARCPGVRPDVLDTPRWRGGSTQPQSPRCADPRSRYLADLPGVLSPRLRRVMAGDFSPRNSFTRLFYCASQYAGRA